MKGHGFSRAATRESRENVTGADNQQERLTSTIASTSNGSQVERFTSGTMRKWNGSQVNDAQVQGVVEGHGFSRAVKVANRRGFSP